MAVLFSAVTLTADNNQVEFLAAGIPRDSDDLEGWTAYENFMDELDSEQEVSVHVEAYPPGTRIMLLGMGNDPNPVESGTRGTVRVVDDIGTLHCDFDNGRSLGVVPCEDSFRKLTDEELAEEQAEDMDENESGPVMGM